MKRSIVLSAALLASGAAVAQTASFDSDAVGRSPAGWTCGSTGRGNPRWMVEADVGAPSAPNVLMQSGASPFPWCVRADAVVADGFVEVKFKPLRGREDQAGGVVWRWKDGSNYYVARANALENNAWGGPCPRARLAPHAGRWCTAMARAAAVNPRHLRLLGEGGKHYKCATLTTMKSCTLPAVRVEPELRAELESVLGKEETISTFVADAVRRAVDFRRVQTDFHARGEAAWQDFLRTGVSHPVDEVFDRVQARIDARRRELQSPRT